MSSKSVDEGRLTDRGFAVHVRAAAPDDARGWWQVRNRRSVRESFFSRDPIPWEAHATWYERELNDPDALMLVAVTDQGAIVGQVRLRRQEHGAEVSIAVAESARGRGCGSALLRGCVELAGASGFAEELVAHILPANARSIQLFSSAGFRCMGTVMTRGAEALEFRRGVLSVSAGST